MKSYSALITTIILIAPMPLAGCNSDPKDALPALQRDAVAKLEETGAKTQVRDGKVVYVDFYGVGDAAKASRHIEALPHVEKLNLSGTNVGDDALAHLEGISELKELGLTGTKVTDHGLAHLSELKKLTILTLNKCNVGDAGLVHVQNLKELRQLHLNGTKVSDAGLDHLAGLDKLESLLVYGTAVTSSGAAAFREKRPETEVVTSDGDSDLGDQ